MTDAISTERTLTDIGSLPMQSTKIYDYFQRKIAPLFPAGKVPLCSTHHVAPPLEADGVTMRIPMSSGSGNVSIARSWPYADGTNGWIRTLGGREVTVCIVSLIVIVMTLFIVDLIEWCCGTMV